MRSSLLVVLVLAACGNGTPKKDSCTQAFCPLGGRTYRFCESAASTCSYISSDNQLFACTSCSDCKGAGNLVAQWCAAGVTTTTGSTTSGTTAGTTSGSTGSTTSGTGTTSGSTGGTTGTMPLNGCHGLVSCLQGCGSDRNCQDDCVVGATENALMLLNQAYFVCPATAFCTQRTDLGVACTAEDLDPNSSAPLTAACATCFNSLTSTQKQNACTNDLKICDADLP